MLVSQTKCLSNTLARENIECSVPESIDSLACFVAQLLKLFKLTQQVTTTLRVAGYSQLLAV